MVCLFRLSGWAVSLVEAWRAVADCFREASGKPVHCCHVFVVCCTIDPLLLVCLRQQECGDGLDGFAGYSRRLGYLQRRQRSLSSHNARMNAIVFGQAVLGRSLMVRQWLLLENCL